MRTAGLIVGAILGWILLVIIVNALLPGTSEMTSARRGGIYFLYIIAAVSLVSALRHSKDPNG